MAEPITWRNVSGPSLADAARPLAYAQMAVNGGFNTLKDALTGYQTGQEKIWKQQDADATQALLAKMYGAKTVEEFDALRASGALDASRADNGARIDRAMINPILDNRANVLQDRAIKDITFKNTMLDDAQQADVRRIGLLTLTDPAAAKAELAAKPDLRAAVQLAQGIDAREQTIKERGRDDTRFSWLSAEEKQKELMRPLDIQAKKAQIVASGLSAQASKLQINKLQREENDVIEARNLDDAVAKAQQKYFVDRNATGKNMGIVAKDLNLPLNSLGHPDFENMTSDQIKSFNTAAAALKTVKIPKAEDFMSGDTKAANVFFDELSASGKFRDATLKKFKENIRGAFDTNAISTRVGNDARNVAVANAQNKVAFDEMDSKNWYAPGHPNVVKAYGDLATNVPNLIDKTSGFGTGEDVADMQALVHEMATRGIETKKGSGKYVTPSVEDMQHAIRTAGGGWFLDSTRAANARKILENLVQQPEVQKKISEGELSAAYRRKEAVKAILNGDKK